MINQIEQKINCPECGEENNIILWERVNIDQHPDLKDKLFSGSLNILKCSKCNTETRVDIPLIYIDGKKNFAVYFAPEHPIDKDEELLENLSKETEGIFDNKYVNRLRIAFDYRMLLEKIKIFDELLDDRVIEASKLVARLQLDLIEGESYYDHKDDSFYNFFFIDQKDIESGKIENVKEYSIPIDMYDAVKELVEKKDKDKGQDFRIVGVKYASEIMKD